MTKTIKILLPVVFAAAAVSLLWIFGVNPYNLLMSLWWPLLTVLEFSVILFYFSSLPYKYVLTALGMGASVIPLVTYLIQKPLNLLLEGSGLQDALSRPEALGTIDLQAPLVAPITEEVTKLLPVLLVLLLLLRMKKYRLLSPVDFALLGLAAGAGFDIFENLCRVMNGYFDILGLYRNEVMEPLPGFFGLAVFPGLIKSEYLGNPTLWFSHAGLTGSIALAAGFSLYLKKKRYIFIPILAYVVCAFDHAMWNWYRPFPEQLWARILPKLTLYGRLIPVLFWLGLVLAAVLLLRNKKRFKAELLQTALPKYPSGPILKKLSVAVYRLRRKNQLTNAFRHYLIKGVKSEPFDYAVAELAGLQTTAAKES